MKAGYFLIHSLLTGVKTALNKAHLTLATLFMLDLSPWTYVWWAISSRQPPPRTEGGESGTSQPLEAFKIPDPGEPRVPVDLNKTEGARTDEIEGVEQLTDWTTLLLVVVCMCVVAGV